MISKIIQRIGSLLTSPEEYPLDVKSVEGLINYTFNDKKNLLLAFKHRSYLSITQEKDYESNERLEFLGDAVLDIIVTEHLFHSFPKEREGFLSQKKSILVSRQVLSQLVEQLGLGKYLLLNKGEEKTGGRTRLSNLANLFESILGAIYLDGGIAPAKKFVDTFLINRQNELLTTKTFVNHKSKLLEYSQSKGWGAPTYYVIDESGPDHQKHFVISVKVNNQVTARGMGSNKKRAEQKAAQNALRKILGNPPRPYTSESASNTDQQSNTKTSD
jgi:ribonuclease-3